MSHPIWIYFVCHSVILFLIPFPPLPPSPSPPLPPPPCKLCLLDERGVYSFHVCSSIHLSVCPSGSTLFAILSFCFLYPSPPPPPPPLPPSPPPLANCVYWMREGYTLFMSVHPSICLSAHPSVTFCVLQGVSNKHCLLTFLLVSTVTEVYIIVWIQHDCQANTVFILDSINSVIRRLWHT